MTIFTNPVSSANDYCVAIERLVGILEEFQDSQNLPHKHPARQLYSWCEDTAEAYLDNDEIEYQHPEHIIENAALKVKGLATTLLVDPLRGFNLEKPVLDRETYVWEKRYLDHYLMLTRQFPILKFKNLSPYDEKIIEEKPFPLAERMIQWMKELPKELQCQVHPQHKGLMANLTNIKLTPPTTVYEAEAQFYKYTTLAKNSLLKAAEKPAAFKVSDALMPMNELTLAPVETAAQVFQDLAIRYEKENKRQEKALHIQAKNFQQATEMELAEIRASSQQRIADIEYWCAENEKTMEIAHAHLKEQAAQLGEKLQKASEDNDLNHNVIQKFKTNLESFRARMAAKEEDLKRVYDANRQLGNQITTLAEKTKEQEALVTANADKIVELSSIIGHQKQTINTHSEKLSQSEKDTFAAQKALIQAEGHAGRLEADNQKCKQKLAQNEQVINHLKGQVSSLERQVDKMDSGCVIS